MGTFVSHLILSKNTCQKAIIGSSKAHKQIEQLMRNE